MNVITEFNDSNLRLLLARLHIRTYFGTFHPWMTRRITRTIVALLVIRPLMMVSKTYGTNFWF